MASRWLRIVLLVSTGVGAAALTLTLTAALAFGEETAFVMGPSALQLPPQATFVDPVNELYLHCDLPTCSTQALFLPNALYPISGVKSLVFDTSAAQGVTILNGAIKQQLDVGNDVMVFGYSQSSTVASLEMADIVNGSAGIHPDPGQLTFVLVGDPSNPNGGLLERFDLPPGSDPYIASLGLTFSGATPVTEYPTTIYTGEYDGFADFPRYPINLLSDINALLGMAFVHIEYTTLTPDQVGGAVPVPTSPGYDGATHYDMIPTEHLPLLDPLRSIPVVGPVLSDLMEPDLRVLVNLGYGDPEYGWVNENANVPTPIGLSPSLGDLEKVPGLLAAGTQQGIQQAIDDLENPSQLFSLADNPVVNLVKIPWLPALIEGDRFLPTEPATPSLLSIANGLNGATSAGYAALLPTADIANAILTALPAYDGDLFLGELAAGDPLDAVGLPISADVGLLAVAGTFELATVGEAAGFAAVDLISPFFDLSSLLS